jgi:hypothetical protein
MRPIWPPAPPLELSLRRQARLLALFGRRQPGHASMRRPHQSRVFPPHPPADVWGPRSPGKGGGEGSAHRFFQFWTQGGAGKLVDNCNCHHALRGSTKRSGRFASFQPPRVGSFIPRVGRFSPSVGFQAGGPSLSLFLKISEEREKKEGAATANGQSTSPFFVSVLYPRVRALFHESFVAEKRGRTQCWRGFGDGSHVHPSIHECFPPGYPETPPAGGAHG